MARRCASLKANVFCEHVEVTVDSQAVTLRVGSVSGAELKQEAVAQGVELQLGFHLWVTLDDGYTAVYDEDVIGVRAGQEFLAVTSDDHAWPLPDNVTANATTNGGRAAHPTVSPPDQQWSLVLEPEMWGDLYDHLLGDYREQAAVILAAHAPDSRGPRLLGRLFIPAYGEDGDCVEGSSGYWSLAPEFVRDTAVRARDQRLAYIAVHNHATSTAGFSHIDLASHHRGYPTLLQITGQPVGALVLTRSTAAGDLWLPNRTRATLTELIAPTDRLPGPTAHLDRTR